jgi:son of sevenless-like protein
LNNFNAASAIVGGLSSAPVYRLKKTWEHVPKKYINVLETEERELMESRANYAIYRQKMRSILEICFPYLGILLSDLTVCICANKVCLFLVH